MISIEKKVVIIGGGISGLAAAFRLKQLSAGRPLAITVVEAGSRFGGVIKTETVDRCMLECGPDSMLTTKPWGVDLMKSLGMESQIFETAPEHRRAFIAGTDCLLPVPEGFRLLAPESMVALAASPCLSLRGKLRAAFEPFIPRNSAMSAGKLPEDYDESLSSFVRRRLGKEALDRLAQPLFAGIYTADPHSLSMRATMPQFLEYEAEFGSVTCGLKEQKKAPKNGRNNSSDAVRYSMFIAPEKGMESLVEELKKQLKDASLKTGCAVSSLRYLQDDRNWRISFADSSSLDADAVILCLPAQEAAKLLRQSDVELAGILSSINYTSSAVINFIVERQNVLHALDGFGFVVPSLLNKYILAAGFSSVKFKGRAPANLAILRAFVGGALFPHLMELSDSEISERAFADLCFYLSIKSPARGLPYLHAQVTRWHNSMPQYAVGHRQTVKAIETKVGAHQGLFLSGAAYEGVGIPDCIRSANQAAEAAINSLFQP
ncbi:MAG: protoporphyrinogen oxidase, partial [Candidatus Melainabacteria bacterium]|nr:protoporphyrinogen oxidase [Candidatus Melainabacteria bacterium]